MFVSVAGICESLNGAVASAIYPPCQHRQLMPFRESISATVSNNRPLTGGGGGGQVHSTYVELCNMRHLTSFLTSDLTGRLSLLAMQPAA